MKEIVEFPNETNDLVAPAIIGYIPLKDSDNEQDWKFDGRINRDDLSYSKSKKVVFNNKKTANKTTKILPAFENGIYTIDFNVRQFRVNSAVGICNVEKTRDNN